MSLDKNTVRKIATLARIRVETDALEPLASELNKILGWVEQLNEVDTKGVPPMTSVVEKSRHHKKTIWFQVLRNVSLE